MSDKTPWILGGILLVAGYGLARSLTSCHALLKAGSRLFLMGDSLSVGMDPYFKKFCQEAGVTYASATKGGTTTSYWISQGRNLANDLVTFSPTLVLISLGTNDSKTNYTQDQLRTHIQTLLDMIDASGAEAVWILPPTLPWAETFSDLVRKTRVRVFESASISIPRSPDGIHPTGAGYAGWSGVIWQTITCAQGQQLQGYPPSPPSRPMTPNVRFLRPAQIPQRRRKRRRT